MKDVKGVKFMENGSALFFVSFTAFMHFMFLT
jgi:hypothetical protein